EVELVLAIGAGIARGAAPTEAVKAVIARAVGIDLTRRDLQDVAKDKRRPWDVAKDFENSAIIAPLSRAPAGPAITLAVNGSLRQQGMLADMIFDEGEILHHLSLFHDLGPGDLVMTGTPAGVAPLQPGDVIEGRIDGLPGLRAEMGAKA